MAWLGVVWRALAGSILRGEEVAARARGGVRDWVRFAHFDVRGILWNVVEGLGTLEVERWAE